MDAKYYNQNSLSSNASMQTPRSMNTEEQDQAAPLPAISIPKGGGAIQGIGEKFSMNPVTGTGGMSIPIATSPGRSGFGPELAVSYDSGAGNGPFGLGWNLSIPTITRKTSKGLPRYQDSDESDVFLLSGAEDLVPALIKNVIGEWENDTYYKDEFYIQRYRPRTEGLFARIEKWTNTSNGDVHWRSVTRDNITSIFGEKPTARIADPQDPTRIFSWLLEETYDDKGNVVVYEYKQENKDSVNASLPQEGKRFTLNKSFSNRYIKRIKYGNQSPGERNNWLFETVFDYGERHFELTGDDGNGNGFVQARKDEGQPWPVRQDPFSSYRAGFEIRTYRLCKRVLMFHHFRELGPEPCLVASTEFHYKQHPHLTKMMSVIQSGYIRNNDGTYSRKSLPPVEFGYTKAQIDEQIYDMDPESLENLPSGLDGGFYQWLDLDGEGLSGVLTEKADAWYYKRNLGNGRFAPSQKLPLTPSLTSLRSGQPQIMDLDGDGQKELVLLDEPVSGFYEKDDKLIVDENNWKAFIPIESIPNLNWNDPNLRFIDLNGDGHADILIAQDELFVWYPSEAEKGFAEAEYVRKALDEDNGPALVFADGTATVFLADMSGDGLTDIVRIQNTDVCYWPNLGYGRFGEKITMDTPPHLDLPGSFDPRRIRLTDIDGSGTIDIIYLGKNKVRLYYNQAGNSWSDVEELTSFPPVDNLSSVNVIDLLGNGTACLVWSSSLPGESDQPMRYIDLMSGVKPHLMDYTTNNMGAETRLQYAPSTKFYLQDRLEGKPWITKLPFPVHVVERMEVREGVTNTKLVTSYKYHHGYFDGIEREFRGFGFVEQLDTESFSAYNGAGLFSEPPVPVDTEFHQPPVLTKTWFHTGAYRLHEKISQHYLDEYYDGDAQAVLLADTEIPQGLTAQEEREACRALRGTMLRQEVYALDDSPESAHPYTVVESKSHIKLIQPQQHNKHASFYVCNCESLSYHYERNPDDPRVAHNHTLEIDEKYGMPLKTAAIAYPRRGTGHPEEQKALYIVYSETDVSHLDESNEFYRIGLPIESRTYEITGLKPGGLIFSKQELKEAIDADDINEIDYEETAPGDEVTKRLIERACTLYLKNDLSGELPKGEVESLALPYESYQLAFSKGHLDKIFADRANVTEDMLRDDGKYFQFVDEEEEADLWWIPSGRVFLSPDPDNPDENFAGDHFYLPQAARDPFGNDSHITYDDYDLLVTEARDSNDNIIAARNDYRLLQPDLVTDPNLNRAAVVFDELGMVIKSVVMGKEGENLGDNLDDPTTRMEYNLFNWMINDKPNFVHTFAREKHGAANPRWQESYVYSDGMGREVMAKVQAEPGQAPYIDANGDLAYRNTSPEVRWVGNGRTVFNNKGNPVKQYEPFFSVTPDYEDEKEFVEWGVTPILRYDPLGRLIRTEMPDGTFSEVEFDPWQQTTFDPNDTVLESEWYAKRIDGGMGAEEQRAAQLTATHADTPALVHLDSLGRPFLSIAHNKKGGTDEFIKTRTVQDIEGNPLRIIDARENDVMTYGKFDDNSYFISAYDIAGRLLYQNSMDAGERWMLTNVAGSLIHGYDSRDHHTSMFYDDLQRPTRMYVEGGDGEEQLDHVVQRMVYGDWKDMTSAERQSSQAQNLIGTVVKLYDQAGLVTTVEIDFKGNVLKSTRQLAMQYKGTLNWPENPGTDLFESEIFRSETEFNALNRPTLLRTPHTDTIPASIVLPEYNEANLLEEMNVELRSGGSKTAFVTNIDYNEKGQRTLIQYANGSETAYTYNPQTFRLIKLKTVRNNDNKVLQDLRYTYDPVGNITEIYDHAQQEIVHDGQQVLPKALYEYDPLYRLIQASGREHPGQNTQVDHTDFMPVISPHPNDPQAMRNYTEQYDYDEVGNILSMVHRMGNLPNPGQTIWNRRYQYALASNRLLSTSLPGDSDADEYSDEQEYSAKYDYDEHGNMTSMPHLPLMQWDWQDQLQASSRQVVNNGGTPEITYYVYDAKGQRSRKVTERQAAAGEEPSCMKERLYLGGFEVYREYSVDGDTVQLQRETLHAMDDEQRIALVETKTVDINDNTGIDVPIIRYHLANHLGSACLELNESAAIISYEEYHPYGTTAYLAGTSVAEVSLKRYRFTGNERDKESGFYYSSARYYLPWLARWCSSDPIYINGGINLFEYGKSNPIFFKDITGMGPAGIGLGEDVSGAPPSRTYRPQEGLKGDRKEAEKIGQTWKASNPKKKPKSKPPVYLGPVEVRSSDPDEEGLYKKKKSLDEEMVQSLKDRAFETKEFGIGIGEGTVEGFDTAGTWLGERFAKEWYSMFGDDLEKELAKNALEQDYNNLVDTVEDIWDNPEKYANAAVDYVKKVLKDPREFGKAIAPGVLIVKNPLLKSITRGRTKSAYPGGHNFTPKKDRYGIYAGKAKSDLGYTDIIIHGSKEGFSHTTQGQVFSPKKFAAMLKKSQNYKGGPIRLLSCDTAGCGATAASELAKELGVEIVAPTKKVWAYPSGHLVVGEGYIDNLGNLVITEPGGWVIFRPN